MTATTRVLVIDDQPRTADGLAARAPELALARAGSWKEAESALEKRIPDLVVLDLRFDLPDEDLLPDCRPLPEGAAGKRLRRDRRERQGLFILERIRRQAPDLPVVLTTAYEDIPFEEEAARLRADAFTYAVAEEAPAAGALWRAVRRVLAESRTPLSTGRFFWGRSSAMRELRRRVAALARTPLPLLVAGPTGTGKNLLVREVLHPASGRKGPLVSFDCATVPESLLASALFGTVRGAFTGAIADRPGVFEAAKEGTLFLDEIENLSPDAQKSLLTALNDGTVRRLGSTREIPHQARVIAASNVALAERVAAGSFRSDLLMRLNPALVLELPPLRERREDLPAIADMAAAAFFNDPTHRREIASAVRAAGGREPSGDFAFLRGDGEMTAGIVFRMPAKAWKAIVKHDWPGNLRQFEMVVTDLLASALYGGAGPAIDGGGGALFEIEPRLAFDLMAGAGTPRTAAEPGWIIPRVTAPNLADFRLELERAVYRLLFRETGGDFARIAQALTGSPREARAARLRFNRLGLSARLER